ncbi:MAG: hypothetical protein K6B13_07115 [Prevotella sp.]|jgi:hypothetical protein|nr:hypothetical protein [Prevotella sp.]
MDKMTKEQTNLFSIIASVLMLVAFFFVKMGYLGAPVEMIGRVGWFGTITLIIAMLAPIYTCLYAFRDQKALEPLKPIFVMGPGLAFALPLISLGLCLFASYIDGGWPVILYAVGAAAIFYIGQKS